MKLPRLSPLLRLTIGLTSMVVSLLLILDFIGLIPNQMEMTRQVRNRSSEALAIQAAALLQHGDVAAVGRAFEDVQARDAQILSLAIRQQDGRLLLAVGEHARHWQAPEEGRSSLDHIQVPVYANRQHWGHVEISYTPAQPKRLLDWLRYPTVILILALGLLSFLAFYLYMRRALQYLDPTTAVPERVRHAFDTLTDAIVIVDREARVMLTNKAFGELHPEARGGAIGKRMDELGWLCAALPGEPEDYPWVKAMRDNSLHDGIVCDLKQPDGETLNVVMQASPIPDPKGYVRGCLVSFDDVTRIHRVNEELRGTLAELEESREQIRRQNEDLQLLASRDPLTGCLNRRAFFDKLEDLFVKYREDRVGFSCIMTDIDHFKQFNDRYGHAVGDEVIRALVRTLQAGLRNDDLLCRYGGEEFCIILPATDLAVTAEIAERLRADVESHAGMSVRTTGGLSITSSYGVATIGAEMRDPAELIERADQALYASKQNGRNRVTVWQPQVNIQEM
jgi:diguanylate cyclase (GGDEF)-like protein/PAS domain S-box-containing protein